jgi:hypothetical protein
LLRCGEAYRRRYIEGEKIPPAVALHVGSSTHSAIRKNLERKIQDGNLMTAQEVSDIARDDLEMRWRGEGVSLQADERLLGENRIKGDAIDKTTRLSLLHHRDLAPSLNPTHVERSFTLDVTGYDFQLAGQIDQQYGVEAIRDVKTASKSPNKDAAETSMQLTMYAMGVWAHEGIIPKSLVLDHLVDTKQPKVVSLDSERAVEDFTPLLNVVQTAWAGIQKGVFYPAAQGGPGNWFCSEKFCGYWPTCKYVRHPVTGKPIGGDLEKPLRDSLVQIGGRK